MREPVDNKYGRVLGKDEDHYGGTKKNSLKTVGVPIDPLSH